MAYLTLHDLVENLIISSFGGAQDAEQRDIRMACQRAYAEVTALRDWQWFRTRYRIETTAPYDTGTITSSGTTVTLTGGTWPSWAATGAYLKVGNEICRVASRTSDSVIVLDSVLTLKDDVTSQAYTLYRTVYPLPSDFRNLDMPIDEDYGMGCYVTPDEAMKMEIVSPTSGSPYYWTIIKDPDSNGWAIKVYGYPTTNQNIDLTYRRTPRAIRYSGHETAARAGTIARTGSAVTGTNTAFTSAMVGSILRIGDTTAIPGPLESMNPWVSESLITAYTSATSITAPSGTVASGTYYLVTDPIDVAPHMQQVMRSAAEYWLAKIRGGKVDDAYGIYQRDIRLAGEQENLLPLSGRDPVTFNDYGWRSVLLPDAGTT
jgi:hypothetical protein